MKNNTFKFVPVLVLAAVSFLIYPVKIFTTAQDTGLPTENVIVDYEEEVSASSSDYMFL